MSGYGLFNFGGTAGLSNTGTAATEYNWGGTSNLMEAGKGLFSDALGAWVEIEKLKAQTNSSGQAQDATRTATAFPSGSVPQTAGVSGGGVAGMSPQMLIVGGVLLVGAVLLLK